MIISGKATQEELKDAWDEIYINYCSRIRYPQSNTLLDLGKQIGVLDCHVLYVKNAVVYLRYRYDEEIINELRYLGYDLYYSEEDTNLKDKQLSKTLSMLKTKIFDLEILKDQYEKLNNMSSSKKHTEDDFLNIVFSVSKFQGFPINRKKTVMDDFIVGYNALLDNLEYLQKQTRNG